MHHRTFGDRVQRLRQGKHLSQDVLADMLSKKVDHKIVHATISKWENNYNLPKIDVLYALADFFGVSPAYLLFGVDEHRDVPLLSRVPAKTPVEPEEEACEENLVPVPPNITDPCDYALRVDGESMIGAGLIPGDIVFCATAEHCEPRHRDMVVALLSTGSTIRWLSREADGTWHLRADNQAYPDDVLRDSDTIHAVVVGYTRPRPQYPFD